MTQLRSCHGCLLQQSCKTYKLGDVHDVQLWYPPTLEFYAVVTMDELDLHGII